MCALALEKERVEVSIVEATMGVSQSKSQFRFGRKERILPLRKRTRSGARLQSHLKS